VLPLDPSGGLRFTTPGHAGIDRGTMILEDAHPSDIPAIATLMNLAFRGSGPVKSWNTESVHIAGDRTSVALIEEDIAAKPGAHLLIVRDETTRAPIASVWLEPTGDDVWYLGSLTIDPALQNSGAGRRMLAASEGWVSARGGRTIRMTVVHVRDTLIAWYLRRGYRLTGETEPFPYDDARFGVPLRDDLHFVVLEKTLSSPPATAAG
jgi:ribosomal protein S18 acetylase RimI-like enzyme